MSKGWRPKQFVRPITIGILKRQNELLLAPVKNDDGQTKGWRPLGGEIEFGETSETALLREFLEELDEKIVVERQLGTVENIYKHEGQVGHEIVFVHQVRFISSVAYEKKQFVFSDGGLPYNATWVDVQFFESSNEQLYPEGLLKILKPSFSP